MPKYFKNTNQQKIKMGVNRYTETQPRFLYIGWGMMKIGFFIFLLNLITGMLKVVNPSNYKFLVAPDTPEEYARQCNVSANLMQVGFKVKAPILSVITAPGTNSTCQKALEHNPDNPQIHLHLGIAKFLVADNSYIDNLHLARDLGKQQKNYQVVAEAENLITAVNEGKKEYQKKSTNKP
jgi:hypothetical protein